jgi:hypothetical protein
MMVSFLPDGKIHSLFFYFIISKGVLERNSTFRKMHFLPPEGGVTAGSRRLGHRFLTR